MMDLRRKILFSFSSAEGIKAVRFRYELFNVFGERIGTRESTFKATAREYSDSLPREAESVALLQVTAAYTSGEVEEIQPVDPRVAAIIVPMGTSWKDIKRRERVLYSQPQHQPEGMDPKQQDDLTERRSQYIALLSILASISFIAIIMIYELL